jgi:hypothetical protein
MYPLNDKDLDRLSRDAAEHYDVESSASGWERLESRLDKELPVKEKDRKRFLFWLFFIVLLTGGSLAYMLGRSPAENNLASEKEEAGVVGKAPADEVSKADADKSTEKKASETTATLQPEKNQKTENPASATVAGKNEPANSAIVKAGNATKTGDKNISAETKDKTGLQKNVTGSNSNQRSVVRNDRSGKPVKSKTNTRPAASNDETPVMNMQDNILSGRDVISPMKTTMPVIDAQKLYGLGKINRDIPAPPAVQETAKKPEVKQKQSKWEFGLLTGPDFSNVKFTHSFKTGFNLGLQVSYRISNRFSVNSGLIYTKKFYEADGKDYHPPKHTPQSYLDMQMVSGNCSMFEIPLNLRYDIAVNRQNRFFVSSGLSSYLMNREYYDYSYLRNGDLYNGNWESDSTSQHILSVLNFSAGFEHNLGKQFSIQAEPYMKLPLKGLGYGNMRISSYGIYFTLKYKPQFRK